MRTVKYIFLILVFLKTVACDRDGLFDDFEKATPWEFHVQVFSDNNRAVKEQGVTINVYKATNISDISSESLMFTKNTDAQGKVIFTKEEFSDKGWSLPNPYDDPSGKGKGVYILSASKDGFATKSEPTKYLLLNDGHTHHFIVIQPQ